MGGAGVRHELLQLWGQINSRNFLIPTTHRTALKLAALQKMQSMHHKTMNARQGSEKKMTLLSFLVHSWTYSYHCESLVVSTCLPSLLFQGRSPQFSTVDRAVTLENQLFYGQDKNLSITPFKLITKQYWTYNSDPSKVCNKFHVWGSPDLLSTCSIIKS